MTTVEPEQKGERRIVVRKEAQTPLLLMAWHATAAAHEDTPALEMLLAILTRGESSRLHRELVEDTQTALQVGGFLRGGFDPGLFNLYATLPPGGDLAAVESRIAAQLQRIAKDGVSEAELAKVRKQMLANFWRGIATISGKAQTLGNFEVFHGDYRKLFAAPELYAKVSSADIQRVAAKYLHDDNRTVGHLLPKSGN